MVDLVRTQYLRKKGYKRVTIKSRLKNNFFNKIVGFPQEIKGPLVLKN